MHVLTNNKMHKVMFKNTVSTGNDAAELCFFEIIEVKDTCASYDSECDNDDDYCFECSWNDCCASSDEPTCEESCDDPPSA